jgi:branched-chain amino acid transport system substrate-binding protein
MKKNLVALLVMLMIALFVLPNSIFADPGKTIKIGILGPMKFSPGQQQWWASTLAAEEINKAGGVLIGGERYDIELVKADSNEFLSVIDATSAAERLINVDRVHFTIGGHRTEAALAIQEVMADNRMIFMNIMSAHPKLVNRVHDNYNRYKYFFRILHNSSMIGKGIFTFINMIGDNIKEELGIDKCKVALVMEKAAWADPIVKVAPNVLNKMGMEIVGVWRPSATAADLTAELTAVKATGAHMIFDGSAGPFGTTIARQWGELKIPTALVGVNVEGGHRRHWEATGGNCEYQVVHINYGRVKMTPKTISFYDKFLNKFKEYPGTTTCAYDAIYVLTDAIKRAGTLENDKLVAALEKTDYIGTLGRIAFNPKEHKLAHEMKWGPKYYTMPGGQWRDGELEVVWPDGKHGGPKYVGFKWKGSVDYKLPPFMVEYWKSKKGSK